MNRNIGTVVFFLVTATVRGQEGANRLESILRGMRDEMGAVGRKFDRQDVSLGRIDRKVDRLGEGVADLRRRVGTLEGGRGGKASHEDHRRPYAPPPTPRDDGRIAVLEREIAQLQMYIQLQQGTAAPRQQERIVVQNLVDPSTRIANLVGAGVSVISLFRGNRGGGYGGGSCAPAYGGYGHQGGVVPYGGYQTPQILNYNLNQVRSGSFAGGGAATFTTPAIPAGTAFSGGVIPFGGGPPRFGGD